MAPKPLSDFPRPQDDNGRGVHWTVNVYPPTGADLTYWVNELKTLQIKWLKLLDDGGGSSLPLCQALLANHIMPIVRLYREEPNPGHIGGREIDAVHRLVAAGVRYFETNNEPDLPDEWRGKQRPANWLDIVVDNFIYDADIILTEGGYPAFPAMGPGDKSNGIAKVVQRGRIDIFERGAWVAIHNYTLNHPLDYPNDPVNQAGRPLTPEDYESYRRWRYSDRSPEEAEALGISREDYRKYQDWAWDGRSRDMINALRAESLRPGQTIFEDANCFRSFEMWGQRIYETLGFYVPVMSTEGGPVVGWGDDKRYAKMSPQTQAEMQMEIMRFMQDEAPPWYFTCCTWLVASRPLGDFNPTWDQMSWYGHAWDRQFGLNGELPLVSSLKSTRSQVRHELRRVENPGVLQGIVTNHDRVAVAGLTLQLRQGDLVVATTTTDASGHYRFSVPAGEYDLFAPWVGIVVQDVALGEDDTDIIDLPSIDAGHFTISGVVRDASGAARPGVTVTLQRNGFIHATTKTAADGAYVFQPGVAGVYALAAPGASASAGVGPLQPHATADLVVPVPAGKRYFLTTKRLLPVAETQGRNLFYGRVVDAEGKGIKNIEMEMRWTKAAPGTQFPRTRTGQNPFLPDPDGYYEFLHSAGEFMVTVAQADFPSDVAEQLLTVGVPGREGDAITYEVDFQLRAVSSPVLAASRVSGSVPGGRVGQVVQLRGGGQEREIALDAGRTFRFEGLPAGVYDLILAGVGVVAPDLALDGSNQYESEFPLLGAIVGQVENLPPGPGSVRLISETFGFTRHAELSPDGHYRFTNLPGGIFRVEMGDNTIASAPHLVSDGRSVLEAPPFVLGPQPTTSTLRGVLHDFPDRPSPHTAVFLYHSLGGLPGDAAIATQMTDEDGAFAFTDLPAGGYALGADKQGIQILARDIKLDGHNDLAVTLLFPEDQMPAQPFARYYLLGVADPALRPALVRLAGPWLATQPPGVVGFSPQEAKKAANIVLLGDGISEEVVDDLIASGSHIDDLRHDLLTLAATLAPVPRPAS